MNENISLEHISEKIGVYISKEHRFGTDAVLLADFCNVKENDTAYDLGTGTGIIPMRWLACTTPPKSVTGIDISKAACALAQKSADEFANGKFRVINTDLREYKLPQGEKEVTLVSCNPPYFKQGSGEQRTGDEYVARCEAESNLFDISACAARLLKYGGRFCICHRPDRLVDVFEAMRANKIEPKRLQTVCAGKHQRVFLVLVEGRKGGNTGLTIEQQIKL